MRRRGRVAGALVAAVGSTMPLSAQEPGAASNGVIALVRSVALHNEPPATLSAYTAYVETEVSVILRGARGEESVAAVEQIASRLAWSRREGMRQTIVGHRVQQIAPTLSVLSFLRSGWLEPVLYGREFRAPGVTGRSGPDVATEGGAGASPLGTGREVRYAFSGGDTTVRLSIAGRAIPIRRIQVEPRDGEGGFRGELLVDADREVLVGMRGSFQRSTGAAPLRPGATAMAYVHYESTEYLGRYWLPTRQRVELAAGVSLLPDTRAVIRLASRFLDVSVREADDTAEGLIPASTSHRLETAARDSLARFGGWRQSIGDASAGMSTLDYADLSPRSWSPLGSRGIQIAVDQPTEVFRFNRVEGAFTGAGVRWGPGSVNPWTVSASAGWAWSEGVARGTVQVERRGYVNRWEVRAGRWLDHTNDFLRPTDRGNTFDALVRSVDAYDYVGRTGVRTELQLGTAASGVSGTMSGAIMSDHPVAATRRRGLGAGRTFRANRGVDAGRYVLASAAVDWRPGYQANLLADAMNARAAVHWARGELSWQRTEAMLNVRRSVGPLRLATRVDAAAVWGSRLPPQQLLEVGGAQTLPGYEDKSLVASRGVLWRGAIEWALPLWREPVRLRQAVLPALAPSVYAAVHAGWLGTRGTAARDATMRLDPALAMEGQLVRHPSSVFLGTRLLGGGLSLGFTRTSGNRGRWVRSLIVGRRW